MDSSKNNDEKSEDFKVMKYVGESTKREHGPIRDYNDQTLYRVI